MACAAGTNVWLRSAAINRPCARAISACSIPAGTRRCACLSQGGKKPSDGILVILNYGSSPADFELGDEALKLMLGSKFVDLLTGDEIILSDAKIPLAGQSARILKAGEPQ